MKRPIQIIFFLTLALSIFAVTAFAADRWVPVPDRISKDYSSIVMPDKDPASRDDATLSSSGDATLSSSGVRPEDPDIKLDPRVRGNDKGGEKELEEEAKNVIPDPDRESSGTNKFARPLGEGSSIETALPPPEEEPAEAQCPIGPNYYECACQGKWIDMSELILPGAISQRINEIVSSNNELYKVGESFLICFNGSIPSDETILITNENNHHIIIYNLNIRFIGEQIHLTFENNIDLISAEISGISLTPLIIRGSNVTIDGLELTSSYRGSGTFKGIKIVGESEDNKIRNIEIVDSSISGAGKFYEDSIGVEIINAAGVTITDNPNSIEKVETGVKGAASVIRTSFKNVVTPIDNPGPVVDVSKVGKHIDLESNTVDRLVGVSPLQDCQSANPHSVNLYEIYIDNQSGQNEIFHKAICNTVALSADTKMCLFYGGESILPETDAELEECVNSGNCECLPSNTCVFDCGSPNILAENEIALSVNNDNQSYSFSVSEVLELPDLLGSIVATMAPTVPSSAGPAGYSPEEPDRIKESGSGDETPSDGTSAANVPEGGDIVGDGLAPLGGGLAGGLTKGGCSLTANNNIFTPAPFALVFMVLLLVGVPVACRVKKKK